MIPVYFGSRQRQLFGVYYPANSKSSLLHGILICPPVGQEYMRTHMALRQLAVLLASTGFDVLKFDYHGIGDSAGESWEGHIEAWEEDVCTAYQELLDMSGVPSVSIVGLRLGAPIAIRAISNGLALKNIILWDPVVNGGEYIADLRKLTAGILDGKVEMDENVEVLVGFPYSIENISLITDTDLLNCDFKPAKNTCLVISEEREEYFKLYSQLKSSGHNVIMRNLARLAAERSVTERKKIEMNAKTMVAQWSGQAFFDQAIIAHHAINEIVSVLKGSK